MNTASCYSGAVELSNRHLFGPAKKATAISGFTASESTNSFVSAEQLRYNFSEWVT